MTRRYWKKSRIFTGSDSHTLLVVPAPVPAVDNPNLAHKRFLVFRPSGNEIKEGRMVEFLGSKKELDKKTDFLLKNYDQNTIPGFTGAILQYDVNFRPIRNASYVNGHKRKNTQTAILKIPGLDRSKIKTLKNLNSLISQLEPGRYQVNQTVYTLKGMMPYQSLIINTNDKLATSFLRDRRSRVQIEGIKLSSKGTNITHSFAKVLGPDRIIKLSEANLMNVIVTLYPIIRDGKGRVEAIQYLINQPGNTKITLQEIDAISKEIKQHFTFDIPSDISDGTRLWPMVQAVNFKRL